MLKNLVLVAFACLMLPGAAFAADDSEAHYQALLTAAKSGTGPVDWTALRFAFADQQAYVPDTDRTERTAMFKAVNANDWAGTLAAANRVLDKNYCSGMAHFVAGMADERLGRAEDGAREKQIAKGLFDSIQSGGDGLSFDHAFNAISLSEEYDTFIIKGVESSGQSLGNNGGHMYDVFTAKDRDGKPVTYYFNIDHLWAAESLTPKPK